MSTTTDTQQPDDLDDDQQQPGDVDQPDDDGDQEPQEGAEQPERDPAAAREQRLRRERREALAERDGLRERLAKYQAREVEAVAGEVLANGGDLLAVRPDLAALLDDAGHVDAGKVREAAEAVATERPHWRLDGREESPFLTRGKPKPSKSQPNSTASGWGAVIRPRGA